ncbi:MAG: hypothetical protein EZS28_030133, partial [Streblomastix strix]
QTVVNQGQKTVNKGKWIQCPFCKKYVDASLLDGHMKKDHEDRELQLYIRLFHKIELTLKLIEKYEKEGPDEFSNTTNRRQKIKAVEDKKRLIEEQQKGKQDDEETLEEKKLNIKIQTIEKQEKVDIDNMTLECLWCRERLILKQLYDHLLEVHPELEDYYRDTQEIFEAQELQQIDHKDIMLGCPYCQTEFEINEIKDHIGETHDKQDLVDYEDIMYHHGYVQEMKQIISNKYTKIKEPFVQMVKEQKDFRLQQRSAKDKQVEELRKKYEEERLRSEQERIKQDQKKKAELDQKKNLEQDKNKKFEEEQRRKDEQEQKRKDEQEQKRKAALDEQKRKNEEDQRRKQEAEKQRKDEDNNNNSSSGSSKCPYCQKPISSSQMSQHILTHDQNQQQLYRSTAIIQPLINMNDGGYGNKDNQELSCPFCDRKTIMLDFHINTNHKDKYQLYRQLLNHHKQMKEDFNGDQNNNNDNDEEEYDDDNNNINQARVKQEEELRKRKIEEEQQRKQEELRKQQEEQQRKQEEQLRKQEELRKQQEQLRIQQEEQRRKKIEEDQIRIEQEQKRLMEMGVGSKMTAIDSKMIEEEQRRKQDEERRRQEEDKRRLDEERKKLQEEQRQKLLEQQKNIAQERAISKSPINTTSPIINQNAKVDCPFCKERIAYSQIDNHIKSHNQSKQDMYHTFPSYLPKLQFNTSTGEYENKKGVKLNCPFCEKQTGMLENHIKVEHEKLYPLLMKLFAHFQQIENIRSNNTDSNKNDKQDEYTQEKSQFQQQFTSNAANFQSVSTFQNNLLESVASFPQASNPQKRSITPGALGPQAMIPRSPSGQLSTQSMKLQPGSKAPMGQPLSMDPNQKLSFASFSGGKSQQAQFLSQQLSGQTKTQNQGQINSLTKLPQLQQNQPKQLETRQPKQFQPNEKQQHQQQQLLTQSFKSGSQTAAQLTGQLQTQSFSSSPQSLPPQKRILSPPVAFDNKLNKNQPGTPLTNSNTTSLNQLPPKYPSTSVPPSIQGQDHKQQKPPLATSPEVTHSQHQQSPQSGGAQSQQSFSGSKQGQQSASYFGQNTQQQAQSMGQFNQSFSSSQKQRGPSPINKLSPQQNQPID